MAHSTPDALAHDLPSHSEVNSSLSFPPPVIPVSSPGDSNPGASNLNVQAESWKPQSSKALGVETLASHGPAIADLGKPPVCPSEPSFLPKPVFPSSSVQCSAPFSPQLPAFFGDNAQSGHVSVPIATSPQPQVISSIPAFCTIYPQTNTMFGAATCTTTVYPNNLVPHGPATSSAEQSPLQVSGHLATDPKWLYTQPRPASGIINPAASGSGYNFENKCKAPCLPSKPDSDKSSINDFARVLVRCQSSRALTEEERYSGDPLRYHQFIRQVEDCILSIHGQSDPGHALQLLIDSTTGRARKLIRSCIMLRPAEALNKALQLLYKAFGCPAVAIKAHLKLVCEGPVIHTDEQSLQDFYSDLVNCKMVVESANATHLLNSVATAEGVFSRLPKSLQERFAERALRLGYDMEVVPFDIFIEFIDHSQRLASSRLGRLMKASKDKVASRSTGWSKARPIRAHVVQMDIREESKASEPAKRAKDSQRLRKCVACETANHGLWQCQKFVSDSLEKRKSLVRQKRLCFNCLGSGHGVKNCPSKARCRTCGESHHTLLHPSTEQSTASTMQKQETSDESGNSKNTSSNVVTHASTGNSYSANAFQERRARNRLQVLPVVLNNPSTGANTKTWALLDTGADTHLLTRDLFDELGLKGQPVHSKLQLADGDVKTFHSLETRCVVHDCNGDNPFVLEEVRVIDELPDLTGSIPTISDVLCNEHLFGLEMPVIDKGKVELLIGTGAPELHVFSEIRHGGEAKLWAGKSPLGWVLFGPDDKHRPHTDDRMDCLNLVAVDKLDLVTREICPCQFEHVDLFSEDDTCLPSIDDGKATKVMESSCELVDGHYSMRLPWRDGCPRLPNNRSIALNRLKSLGRRLMKEPETLALYQGKMSEMIQSGHAFEVEQDCENDVENRTWYIPHHCTTKKFRVVFDCAATCGGTSLNQQLMQGPDNTSTLIGVLLRFRMYPVVLVGDVKNMFHQVKVHPEDQPALRFLWWRDGHPDKPVKTYQLAVHTFGLTSSPSVAGYALRRTADENLTNASELTLAAIKEHFYVDDLLMSVRTSEQATQLVTELDSVLGSGGFTLAKYASNRPEVLETLPADRLALPFQDVYLHGGDLPTHKTLGLIWDASTDQFRVKIAIADHPLTRRGLLSVLASVYDPLGIAGPYTLPAKILIQRLTKQDLGWDVEISDDAKSDWKRWLNDLPLLDGLAIPRVYDGYENAKSVQLHFFADASKHGYGTVCYLRSSNGSSHSCTFVMGKSRVAPIITQSIPRLELCAAVTAVRLSRIVLRELYFPIREVYFWSDSTTVLSYLSNTSKRRPAFETNRIATIRKHTEVGQWQWIDTLHNPADLYSRGVAPRQLQKAEKWLKAPDFLLKDEALWPLSSENDMTSNETSTVCGTEDSLMRQCSHIVTAQVSTPPASDSFSVPEVIVRITTKFSVLSRAIKSTVWLLRAKRFLQGRVQDKATPSPVNQSIGAKEYDDALLILIRLVQLQEFPGLVEALEQHPWHEVAKGKSGRRPKQALQPLLKYCPFVSDGVMRIGGRLQRSTMTNDFKHPIVLPKRHHFTGLIIYHYHSELGHNASHYVMNSLRSRYHVIGQERTVRHYIKQTCMVCRNRNASFGTQLMAPLPPARVEAGRSAFENSGVDYMGPLDVKQGRSSVKRYCCVFTCLASRAVHLEMAYDLTTESFLMALRRFLSTRGHSVRAIYSDNGTNFIGAQAELRRGIQRLNQLRIVNELSPKGVEWHHAPPLASHQGGVYEAMIRLIRKAMDALMTDRKLRTLTDEGLVTLFKEIEYILNCRPLTRVSTDPEDVETLSPIMLLTGSLAPGLAPDVFMDTDGMRSSWRSCQFQIETFWRRWQTEYLQLLQRRQKWLAPQRNLKENDLVLILDESQPRNLWPKGIVQEVFPDRDDLVRRVKVRTAFGKTFVRDIRKLCLLEGDVDDSTLP